MNYAYFQVSFSFNIIVDLMLISECSLRFKNDMSLKFSYQLRLWAAQVDQKMTIDDITYLVMRFVYILDMKKNMK